ncbi:hypothetical protein WA026_015383, partial [Henosepilachna vigintioctopunctata]
MIHLALLLQKKLAKLQKKLLVLILLALEEQNKRLKIDYHHWFCILKQMKTHKEV